jgi:hypothetical protein
MAHTIKWYHYPQSAHWHVAQKQPSTDVDLACFCLQHAPLACSSAQPPWQFVHAQSLQKQPVDFAWAQANNPPAINKALNAIVRNMERFSSSMGLDGARRST